MGAVFDEHGQLHRTTPILQSAPRPPRVPCTSTSVRRGLRLAAVLNEQVPSGRSRRSRKLVEIVDMTFVVARWLLDIGLLRGGVRLAGIQEAGLGWWIYGEPFQQWRRPSPIHAEAARHMVRVAAHGEAGGDGRSQAGGHLHGIQLMSQALTDRADLVLGWR